MDRYCESIACTREEIEKLRGRAEKAEAEALQERLRADSAMAFVALVAKHPDIGDALTSTERETALQARAREVFHDVRAALVHPDDVSRTMLESHCGKCARCQTYKRMADEEAKAHGLRATSYREELLQIVSYLAHYDQDANHAWMVRRIRAVLAGKNPSKVEGWTEHDGVPAPKPVPQKVVGTQYPPPSKLWFHFHPAPHVIAPDGEERLGDSGDLWHDPYESEEEANAALGESAVDGWIVVGPYTFVEGSAP